jgi:hypothetical protein
MRKLLLVGAVCLVMACGESTSPTEGVQVGASAVPTLITVGGSIEVNLTVFNAGSETRKIILSHCTPPYEIVNAAGVVVAPGDRACTLEVQAPTTLPPLTSVDFSDTWTGDAKSPSGSPLPAGTYRIRPRVMVVGADYVYGNEIQITISPP